MGVRHPQVEELRRLCEKNLDTVFLHELRDGLNCSPIEAKAVLMMVKETYFAFLNEQQLTLRPGQICLYAIDLDEPAGKPVAACAKRRIFLTVHRGEEDDGVLQQQGPTAFRRGRIADLLMEAIDQHALLTREDLAYHIFHVCLRTISYDLQVLRLQTPTPALPLRGTYHDIGPVLTHRRAIIELALIGRTTSEICQQTCHTSASVANYLSIFRRTVVLAMKGVPTDQIAFILHRSPQLIAQYYAIWEHYRDDHRLTALISNMDPFPLTAEQEKGGCPWPVQ